MAATVDYGSASYWDERYALLDDEHYDWYQDYSTLREYLEQYMDRDQGADIEILIPGCGSSRLGADLYDDGFVNITNIDISAVVISKMTDAHLGKEEMECKYKVSCAIRCATA
jgi:Thiopurine S-methyltransferase (TPMT)